MENNLDNMSLSMFNNSSLALPSDHFRDELKQYVTRVNHILLFIQAFICIMGILGNLLAFIVINRKSLKTTSSAVFITHMAIFDTLVLLSHATSLIQTPRNLYFQCSLTYLTDLSTFWANWVLVIITLERCVAVHSPFLAKRFCTVESAHRSMYILFAVSIIVHSVTFPFIYQITNASKSQKCLVYPKAALKLRIYQPILFYAIPDLLLLSNLFTVYALCRRRHRLSLAYLKNGEKLEIRITDIHSNRKQRQLTIMLVTVSLSFYLFTTPSMIMYIAEYQRPKHRQIEKIKQMFLLGQITVVLGQLNNATNFLFYCFAGQRFRQATTQTLKQYSRELKIFYHRYILCDKRYNLAPIQDQHRRSSVAHTTLVNRNSGSPYHQKFQFRQSTI